MKKLSIFRILPVTTILLALLVIFAGVSYFFCDFYVFIAEISIAAAVCIAACIRLALIKNNIHKYFDAIIKSTEKVGSESLSSFVMPLLVTQDKGDIVWYNNAFSIEVLGGEDIFGEAESLMFDRTALDNFAHENTAEIWYHNRFYKVYSYTVRVAGAKQNIYYFSDRTKEREITDKWKNSRLRVMYIQIDNLDMLTKNAVESEKTTVISSIEREIERLADECGAYLQKISSDLCILIIEQSKFQGVIDGKFKILKAIREMNFGERGNPTLSIGVGRGCDTINESKKQAQEALDMAVGRGGDQAAIKTKEGFEFFGGISQATSKNSRVRTRVIATTLMKLIENSDSVLLMGHAYSDMDCFGAAYGLHRAITSLGRDAHIIVDTEKTLCSSLIKYVDKDNIDDIVISPEKALSQINKKTLLIILDTHRASFVESREVYEKASTVVVVDHHRKTVDYIDNSLVFYHDPSASSACEMVSELLQYMGPNLIGKTEAEALLSGIMLDTRNLVLRTGTRTYEAAAYLRGRGADPVAVKKLFSDSMDIYKIRTDIVSSACVVENCAIAVCEKQGENIRLASSQAADELLSISGVNASFVIFESEGSIVISARSLGAVNVQLIMERLGGGGHQTMAASQLKGETFERAKELLIQAINEFAEKD